MAKQERGQYAPATMEQLLRVFPPKVAQGLAKLQEELPQVQRDHVGENPYSYIYQQFQALVTPVSKSVEEVASNMTVVFGVSIKMAAEFFIGNPLDKQKQMIYKLARDKRELMGFRRKQDTFLNAQQLQQFCVQLVSKHKQPSLELLVTEICAFADQTLGAEEWDRNVLNAAYLDSVQRKIKMLQQTDIGSASRRGQTITTEDLQRQRMKEVAEKLKMQQVQLQVQYKQAQAAIIRQNIETKEAGVGGSKPWLEESSD